MTTQCSRPRSGSLSRRIILAGLPLLPLFRALPAAAAGQPYQARIFSAGFDGSRYVGGLQITMDPGWKTYWRVPGEGGIPPSLDARGDNIAAFSFDCPLPHRIASEGGEAIGYKDEVIFPWSLVPADPSKPVKASFAAFVGVCETVCIPVNLTQDLGLEPVGIATPETALVARWQARVPQEGRIVSAVSAGEDDGVHVDVELSAPAQDVFVEGNAMHFFLAPQWSADRRHARLKVHGAKSAGELRNRLLRMTFVTDDTLPAGGLEQTVSVR